MSKSMDKAQWLALAMHGDAGQRKWAEDFFRDGACSHLTFENTIQGFFAEMVAAEFLDDARPGNWDFYPNNNFVYPMSETLDSGLKGKPDGWYCSRALRHLTFEVKSGRPWAFGSDETKVWFAKTHNADRLIWVRDKCVRVASRVSDKYSDGIESPALYELTLLCSAREYINRADERLRLIAQQ
jgi:hypothetical protein